MKVVLINPPLTSKQRLYKELSAVKINYPPLGLCYLASVLREKGFGVKILDLQIEEGDHRHSDNRKREESRLGFFAPTPVGAQNEMEFSLKKQAQRILREKPDFIGMTATSVAIQNVARLASELKRETKAPIILGGPHVTAVPQRTMELFPQFDFGVIGEGEETLPELLLVLKKHLRGEARGLVGEHLGSGEISGLVVRASRRHLRAEARQSTREHLGGGAVRLTPPRKPIRNLDSLPLPAFDLLPDFSHYGGSQFIEFDTRPTFRLVTSRGCPFHCTFCDKSVFGKTFRAHSPEYVLKMIKILYEDYGIRHIYFSDDTFTLDRKRIFKLCQLIKQEKLDLTWDCNTRVDMADPELLRAMKNAGCAYIAYGIETGNQQILDILGKGTTLEQIRKACDWTVKAGIKIRGNFMMGNPGETKETIEETVRFAKSLPLYTFKMSFFTPFPNTQIYEEIDKWGEYQEDWSRLSKYSPVFTPKGLTQKELESYYKKAYFSFYFRPRIISQILSQLRSLTALRYVLKNFFILSRFLLGKRLKRHQSFITLITSLLIFGLLFAKIEVEGTIKAVSLVDQKLFFLACFLSVGMNFFWVTEKWRRILQVLGYNVPYKKLLLPRIGGYSFHGTLPLKTGEVSRIAYLKKFHQVPWKVGIASVVITLALNILSLVIFMVWGFAT